MEFNEKLQELRKKKGLTQEDLAEALFVSRTAVSKWESGRGYPSIDSLKAIAKFFGVSIDALLSGDEILTIAEADQRQKELRSRDLIFGLLDIGTAMFFFLPIFGQTINGTVQNTTLLTLTQTAPYMKVAYLSVVSGIVLLGILTLALQNCKKTVWVQNKSRLSLFLSVAGVLLFMASPQPYAGAFLFVFLLIKALLLIKKL